VFEIFKQFIYRCATHIHFPILFSIWLSFACFIGILFVVDNTVTLLGTNKLGIWKSILIGKSKEALMLINCEKELNSFLNYFWAERFSVSCSSMGSDFCTGPVYRRLLLYCSFHHAYWHETCSRPRSVSKSVSVYVQTRGGSPLSRPQSRRSAAGSGGRAAGFCPLRPGESSQRLRLHRSWKHQADELRLWSQRNRAERWDRYEMWEVCSDDICVYLMCKTVKCYLWAKLVQYDY